MAISIHAPPRGATWSAPLEEVCTPDFNSRPSARGDNVAQRFRCSCHISIHAPPRGATAAGRARVLRRIHFNSRPSARGDNILCPAVPLAFISIHAPPRGATAYLCNGAPCGIFQFTPLREGRLYILRFFFFLSNFNSRPSARGDGRVVFLSFVAFYFNSRPSARGDGRTRGGNATRTPDFNSRPSARGDIVASVSMVKSTVISIHAPPRGATARLMQSITLSLISIHAPPRGATDSTSTTSSPRTFQFTPLREGRRAFPPLVRR